MGAQRPWKKGVASICIEFFFIQEKTKKQLIGATIPEFPNMVT